MPGRSYSQRRYDTSWMWTFLVIPENPSPHIWCPQNYPFVEIQRFVNVLLFSAQRCVLLSPVFLLAKRLAVGAKVSGWGEGGYPLCFSANDKFWEKKNVIPGFSSMVCSVVWTYQLKYNYANGIFPSGIPYNGNSYFLHV